MMNLLTIITFMLFILLLITVIYYVYTKTLFVRTKTEQVNEGNYIDDDIDARMKKLDTINSRLETTENLLRFIYSLTSPEVQKIMMRQARLGKRYDENSLEKDADKIVQTVLKSIPLDVKIYAFDTYNKDWLEEKIKSDAFSLLVKESAEYNNVV